MKNRLIPLIFGLAIATSSSFGQNLFSDNFDTDSSANWTAFEGHITATNVPDYGALFAFDYSTNTFVRNGVTNVIPPAPNGGGTTKGLKLTINDDNFGDPAVVSLYPNGQSFSGNYAMRFDMWVNYPGGAYGAGGSGSTESSTFGLNHPGTRVNWDTANASFPSDGVWFAATGEGGSSAVLGDYQAFVGDGSAVRTPLRGVDGGFLDRDNDGNFESESAPAQAASYPLKAMFPSPTFETPGAPGKQWVQVEIRQKNLGGTLTYTWLIDGYVIAEHANNFNQTSGNIMLGYMDIFGSISTPKPDSFVLFDNLRVVNLDLVTALPELSIDATDNDASEPNDTATFTVTRTGNTDSALVVNYRSVGTAGNGTDFQTLSGNTTIPVGQASTTITVTPIDDPLAESDELIVLTLAAAPGTYEVRDGWAAATLHDNGDTTPVVTVAAISRTNLYEYNTGLSGKFSVTLNTAPTSPLPVNYTMSGTATNGTHYVTLSGTATIDPGQTNAVIDITPLNNNIADGTRTVVMNLTTGTGYVLGSPTNASITIRDDDVYPVGSPAFSATFESDVSTDWNINKSGTTDEAYFGYNYAADGIPSAPNSSGTTLGLKLKANTNGVSSGVSVSPKNQSFSGDYILRFDAWINYNGPILTGGVGSTEMLSAGIGTTGTVPHFGANGSGLKFDWDGDGGTTADYRTYSNAVALTTGFAAGSRESATAYYNLFGGESAPAAQTAAYPTNQIGVTGAGATGFSWRDVVVIKEGSVVKWYIDSLLIATVNAGAMPLSGNISVGYWDPFTSSSPIPAVSFGLVDNLRVISLNVQPPTLNVSRTSNSVTLTWTGNFSLQESSSLTSPSWNTVSSTSGYTTNSASGTRFYRLISN